MTKEQLEQLNKFMSAVTEDTHTIVVGVQAKDGMATYFSAGAASEVVFLANLISVHQVTKGLDVAPMLKAVE